VDIRREIQLIIILSTCYSIYSGDIPKYSSNLLASSNSHCRVDIRREIQLIISLSTYYNCWKHYYGEKYLKLLKGDVIPDINASEVPIIFQQDNAPAHKNTKKPSATAFLS